MEEWPGDELLAQVPKLPVTKRIRRYQHNIPTIRTSECVVPTSAMIDSLDPAKIELWFADSAFRIDRLGKVVSELAAATDDPDLRHTRRSRARARE